MMWFASWFNKIVLAAVLKREQGPRPKLKDHLGDWGNNPGWRAQWLGDQRANRRGCKNGQGLAVHWIMSWEKCRWMGCGSEQGCLPLCTEQGSANHSECRVKSIVWNCMIGPMDKSEESRFLTQATNKMEVAINWNGEYWGKNEFGGGWKIIRRSALDIVNSRGH